jgi:hypothetical protein
VRAGRARPATPRSSRRWPPGFDQAAGGGERLDSAVDVRGTITADAAPAEGGARLVIDVDAIRAGREWARRRRSHSSACRRCAQRSRPGRLDSRPRRRRADDAAPAAAVAELRWTKRGMATTEARLRSQRVDQERIAHRRERQHGPLAEAAAAVRARVRRTVASGFGGARASSGAVVTAILIGDRAGRRR